MNAPAVVAPQDELAARINAELPSPAHIGGRCAVREFTILLNPGKKLPVLQACLHRQQQLAAPDGMHDSVGSIPLRMYMIGSGFPISSLSSLFGPLHEKGAPADDADHEDGEHHVDHGAGDDVQQPVHGEHVADGATHRDDDGVRAQVLAMLLDAWDSATPETRLDFLTRAHVHDEIMDIVNCRKAA